MASWIRTAATAESTPPDNPQITRPLPTCARILSIASALKAAQLELKSYSAALAIDLARQKVRARMTPSDQDALVQNFVADLARQNLTGPSLEHGTTS